MWLVTAAPVEIARVISRRLGLTGAMGTVAEHEDGVYTGRLVGDMLHGPAKAEAVRALAERDREYLVGELARATGLGGRQRRSGSAAERARTSVTRTLRYSIERIAEHHAALGEHLEQTVVTGTYCSYAPDPRSPVDWAV